MAKKLDILDHKLKKNTVINLLKAYQLRMLPPTAVSKGCADIRDYNHPQC